jgi:uncharacterized DUF497 family protein
MDTTFDPAKRALTRRHRGLDFAQASEVFDGRTAPQRSSTTVSTMARCVSSVRVISTAVWW